MMEMAEELDFAEGTETEHGVVKGRNLLDGDLTAGGSVNSRTDNAVGTLADDIEHLVVGSCIQCIPDQLASPLLGYLMPGGDDSERLTCHVAIVQAKLSPLAQKQYRRGTNRR